MFVISNLAEPDIKSECPAIFPSGTQHIALAMLSEKPPTAAAVKNFHIFWSVEKTIGFFSNLLKLPLQDKEVAAGWQLMDNELRHLIFAKTSDTEWLMKLQQQIQKDFEKASVTNQDFAGKASRDLVAGIVRQHCPRLVFLRRVKPDENQIFEEWQARFPKLVHVAWIRFRKARGKLGAEYYPL